MAAESIGGATGSVAAAVVAAVVVVSLVVVSALSPLLSEQELKLTTIAAAAARSLVCFISWGNFAKDNVLIVRYQPMGVPLISNTNAIH
jgi:hypothetical protein